MAGWGREGKRAIGKGNVKQKSSCATVTGLGYVVSVLETNLSIIFIYYG